MASDKRSNPIQGDGDPLVTSKLMRTVQADVTILPHQHSFCIHPLSTSMHDTQALCDGSSRTLQHPPPTSPAAHQKGYHTHHSSNALSDSVGSLRLDEQAVHARLVCELCQQPGSMCAGYAAVLGAISPGALRLRHDPLETSQNDPRRLGVLLWKERRTIMETRRVGQMQGLLQGSGTPAGLRAGGACKRPGT